MPRISRRGFLGGALVGIATPLPAAAQDPSNDAPESAAGGEPPVALPAPETPEARDRVTTRFFCNGEERQLPVLAETSALDVIRGLGWTGAKLSCGGGACGACTVLVDGEPRVTCLLPATALEGRSITTVEAVAVGPAISQMHPVQRAFLAEDALQCGYCTPGFIVEAVAFHDRWRATHGATEPDRGAIARALSGHLCRCGAYPAIYRAVAAACRGDHDAQRITVPRVDGPEKVTGQARYATDVRLEGMLVARVLRSAIAHGVLHEVNLDAARALPGVKAIYRVLPDGGRIRFVGQELVAVAAESEVAARRAVDLIALRVEELPAAITTEQARKPNAPLVYDPPPKLRDAPAAGEVPGGPARWEGNVRGPASSSWLMQPGRARRANEKAEERTVRGQWRTAVQAHTCLEPHAAVAWFRSTGASGLGDAVLEVWASTQSCMALAEDLAQRFKLKRDQVVVHCPFVGGAFGAKAGLQMETLMAVELAREAGVPVQVVLDREDELMVGGNRPAQQIDLAIGASEAGELVGIEHQSVNSSGVAVGHASGFVTRLIYDTSAKDLDDFDVVTHTPPAMPFRGPGGPPTFFALEGAIDQLAHNQKKDPLALRRAWDDHLGRNKLYDWAESLPIWRDRSAVGAAEGRFRRGVGLAAGAWFHLWDPGTQVEIEAGPEGIVARVATQDVGTGTKSLVAEAIAGKLGLLRTNVEVQLGDSRFKHGPASSGSKVASSVAPAAEHAAEELVNVLVERAAAQGIEGQVEARGIRPVGGTLVPWRDFLVGQPPVWTVGRRRRDTKPALLPIALGDTKIGRVNSAVVNVMEVEVDTRLGRVRVLNAWVGIGAGRIVTPTLARSQIEGGVIQGISYALFEERRLDEATGQLLTHGLDDYRIAGIGDAPEVHVHFEPSGFEHVRGGAVGLGEVSTVSVAASIANAVFHATGVRPYDLPLNPGRLVGLLS